MPFLWQTRLEDPDRIGMKLGAQKLKKKQPPQGSGCGHSRWTMGMYKDYTIK